MTGARQNFRAAEYEVGRDIYNKITDQIVATLETAGEWQRPWKGAGGLPSNALTKNNYNGVNILALWIAQQVNGWGSSEFATYRQWAERDAQVRKGSKATFVVFFKEYETEPKAEDDDGKRRVARATPVFNADQVDGYKPEPEIIEPLAKRIQAAEDFVMATGAIIQTGGQPCYIPPRDFIQMPSIEAFTGTTTSTATESYYATLLHELGHWSGAKTRLDRDLTGRFGKEAYAMEELIAELSSSFNCAHLGIVFEPKPDTTAYIKNWLTVLRGDKKAIFTAASAASKAAAYLSEFSQPKRPEPEAAATPTLAPAP